MTDDVKKQAWYVTIPVCGSVCVYVQSAADAEEAVDLAFDKQDWRIESGADTEPGEFETLRRVASGNVLYAPCWEFSAEETDD